MKEKLYKFLQGRNGADQLTKVLMYVSITFLILGTLLDWSIFTLISLVLIIYANFRVFSRNLPARITENQMFLHKTKNIRTRIIRFRNHTFGKDGKRYLYCSNCNAELRVPKVNHDINVICPKCKSTTVVKK